MKTDNKTAPTPGPWRVIDGSLDIVGDNPNHRRFIAEALESNDSDGLPSVHQDQEAFAYARLIAAAPELLAKLKQLLNSAVWAKQMLGDILETSHFAQTIVEARNAIAEAEGQS